MSELNGKIIQDMLDKQSDMLTDLFFRLEQSQKNTNKSLTDAINRLSETLGLKITQMQNLSNASRTYSNNNNVDISKLTNSIDNLAAKTNAQAADTVKTSDVTNKTIEALISFTKGAVQTIVRSFETTTNQLNLTRQAEVNGVLTTFADLRESVKQSGVSLSEFADVTNRYSKVMMNLNAMGLKNMKAFQEQGTQAYNVLRQDSSISFTQSEVYEVEGALLEIARRYGKFEDVVNGNIATQTAAFAKMIDSISKMTGSSREEVVSNFKKGYNPVQLYGYATQGFDTKQADLLNVASTTLKTMFGEQLGPGIAGAFSTLAATGGIRDQAVFQNTFGVFGDEFVSSLMGLSQQIANGSVTSYEDIKKYIGSNILPAASNVAANFQENGIAFHAVAGDQALSNTAQLVQSLPSILNLYNQQQRFDETLSGEPGGVEKRQETMSMLNAQADMSRQLTNASNELRDALMDLTATTGAYTGVLKDMIGLYGEAASGLKEVVGTLSEKVGEAYGTPDNSSNSGLISSAEASPLVEELSGIETDSGFTTTDLIKYGALGAVGAAGVSKLKNSKAAQKIAQSLSKGKKVPTTPTKTLKGLRHAGKVFGLLSLLIDGKNIYDELKEEDYRGATATAGGAASAWAGAAAGAALGTPFGGPFGATIGAILGAIALGSVGENLSGKAYDYFTKDKLSDIKPAMTEYMKNSQNSSVSTIDENMDRNYNNQLVNLLSEQNELSRRTLSAMESIDRKTAATNLFV